jgi:hypothetical protein
LVQQAGYTLGVAALEGTALAGKLPANFLDRAAILRNDVDKALQDKTVLAAEARQATTTQNQHQRDATVWVRGGGKRCQNAMQLGAALPPEMGKVSCPQAVPAVLEQMSKTLALLTENVAAMDAIGAPTQPLIDEGQMIFKSLQDADSTQERLRAADMPAAVTAFCLKKAELYDALKIINNAGHELYAHNLAEAGKFNMSILHRRGPQAAAPEPTPPASPANPPM